jgi:hypothetical protein
VWRIENYPPGTSKISTSRGTPERDHVHDASGSDTYNRDSQDPPKEDPPESPPIERTPIPIAKRNTKGGTDNAHGRRHGQSIVGGENDGDRRAQFHGEAA